MADSKDCKDILTGELEVGPNPTDPRCEGWPCKTYHLPYTKSNGYGTWTKCNRCGLRMNYKARESWNGKTRAAGPMPEIVEAALHSLKEQGWKDKQLTAKIVEAEIEIYEAKRKQVVSTSKPKKTPKNKQKDKEETSPPAAPRRVQSASGASASGATASSSKAETLEAQVKTLMAAMVSMEQEIAKKTPVDDMRDASKRGATD